MSYSFAMARHVYGRVIALLLFVTASSLWLMRDVTKDSMLGREEYLKTKGRFFDKYLSNCSQYSTAHFIGYMFVIVCYLAT